MEKEAKKIWEKRYREKKEVKDFTSRTMVYEHYGRTDLDTGWNIHHIMPKAIKEINEDSNYELVCISTNIEIGSKISFNIKGIEYCIRKVVGGGYVIVCTKNNEIVSNNIQSPKLKKTKKKKSKKNYKHFDDDLVFEDPGLWSEDF